MWIIPESMYCRSALVEGDLTKPSDSWFQTLASSVTLNETLSPARSWSKRWHKDKWLQRLSGLTSLVSTECPTVDAWTSSQRVFLANRSVSPESVLARAIHDTCGRKWLASSARSNQHLYFSRTCQGSSIMDSERSVQDLKDWVSTLRLVCLRRKKRVVATRGNECSSWPTASATDYKGSSRPGQRRNQLDEAVEQKWPTPDAGNDHRGDTIEEYGGSGNPFRSLPLDQAPIGDRSSSKTRRLNPRFVAYLMGWPLPADSGCGFLETESSQFRARMRSQLSGLFWRRTMIERPDNGPLFDLAESERRKREGMARASNADARKDMLDTARQIARTLAMTRLSRECHADEVQSVMVEDYGDDAIQTLGNAAGSIFKGGSWENTGKRVKSERVRNHRNYLFVWRYTGD